ncbi:SIR2 family protein [Novosphingobium sp.]|uniref:SIR2 family protein n=1 Tax=Novosphingobium sp. TaxID=1874826 RepID=UPI0038BA1196
MSIDDLNNQTYLSKIYFNESSLKSFALQEFVRSVRSGRLTAFIGSLVTEELGYPKWKELLRDIGIAAGALPAPKEVIKKFEEELWEWLSAEMAANPAFDARIAASVIGHWFDHRTGRRSSRVDLNKMIAAGLADYKDKTRKPGGDAILRALIEDLQIKRFITTNYDVEIEASLARLLPQEVHQHFGTLPEVRGDSGTERSADEQVALDSSASEGERIKLANGLVIASDAFQRERLDRLIEFSLGSTQTDLHVLHLHGRIDKPETMVISYRDYDRIYRRAGATRAPFEQTLAMLHSSNPVLFVGLGMKEPELNEALEYLIGNQPFKGVGRRFLLWSPPQARETVPADKVRAAFRLEKLHKLGVLTIFNDEIAQAAWLARAPVAGGAAKSNVAAGLAHAITNLGRHFTASKQARLRKPDAITWRDVDFLRNLTHDTLIYTWQFERKVDANTFSATTRPLVTRDDVTKHCLTVLTTRPGTGKGRAATELALNWAYDYPADKTPVLNPDRPVLLVNMSLRLDTDSALELIYLFLGRISAKPDYRNRHCSREREFLADDGALFYCAEAAPDQTSRTAPLIVFKGLERLFNKGGVPLSAEMDRFFRAYLVAAIKGPPAASKAASDTETTASLEICPMVVFGTRRIRTYFRRLERQVRAQLGAPEQARAITAALARSRPGPTPSERADRIIKVDRDDREPNGYLGALRKSFQLDGTSPPLLLANDRAYARETYRGVFASKRFHQAFDPNMDHGKVAFAVLTVMAFIGQPVEPDVLFHAPRVERLLKALPVDERRSMLDAVIKRLASDEFRLIFKIGNPVGDRFELKPTNGFAMDRYALHMSLQAEFRERYGVPLSEAVLSTSFNMALYVAQPADGAVAEPEIHDELGRLIDWLIGAYRDADTYDPNHALLPGEESGPRRRARPHIAACLRGALAIVRGFYSTSALLSLDLGNRLIDEQRDGALTEHADRLERLITAVEEQGKAREELATLLSGRGSSPEAVRAALGPGAIYRDELVWLYNELGVVKLAQGDMYEARVNLNEADRINAREVEFTCRSHNWRRIWLNLILVDVERGKLSAAEDRVARIENSFDDKNMVERIRKVLSNVTPGVVPKLPLSISHEDCLSAALTTGFRALIMFLRGELNPAEGMFALAIAMLEYLDEQRACAFFRRHWAALQYITNGSAQGSTQAKLAIAVAESVQQMDIVYGAKIVRALELADSSDAGCRREAMVTLTRAIEFATETDLHRIAIEARRNLARLKLNNGDLESALEHASIAAALAGRYGMTLYKVTIRIMLGQILHARGTRDAADAMISNAIGEAGRIGYQRAIEAAQFARARLR